MPAPFRTCDHCSKPAVVHNTVIVNGTMNELHLCEEHAAQAGIQMPGAAPIKELLGQLAQAVPGRPRGPACPECGHPFADFKTSGLLGCAACASCPSSSLMGAAPGIWMPACAACSSQRCSSFIVPFTMTVLCTTAGLEQ